ncbi:MAG: hypothetical protein ABIN95_09825 [Mucilaginibacter sp.]
MPFSVNSFFRLSISIAFIISSTDSSAQTSSIQQTINKIESYKNFSYRSVNIEKELLVDDTVIKTEHALFEKMPPDKNFGYLFNVEATAGKDVFTEWYDGQKLVYMRPTDSTYEVRQIREFMIERKRCMAT